MFLCYGFYVFIMAYNQSLMSCMAKCAGEDDENGKEATDLLIMKEFYSGAVGAFIVVDPSDCCTSKSFEHFEPRARNISGVNDVTYDSEQSIVCVQFDPKSEVSKHREIFEGFAREAIQAAENVKETESKLIVDCKVIKIKKKNIQPDIECDKSDIDNHDDED